MIAVWKELIAVAVLIWLENVNIKNCYFILNGFNEKNFKSDREGFEKLRVFLKNSINPI